MNYPYTCKICGTPGIAEAYDDCPVEWMKKLAPLLACDPCADLKTRLLNARDSILRACKALVRGEEIGIKPEDMATIRRKCREVLMRSTREYADVIRIYRKSDKLVWSEDFAENLLTSPGKAVSLLRFYRESVK